MLNQLELQLCIVSHLPEHEEERGRIEKYFLDTKTVRFEHFSEHLVENPLEDNENRNRFLLQTAKRYIENPEAFPPILYDPKRHLKELASSRLHRLQDTVDRTEAELLYSDSCKLSEKEKFLFRKRFEYIRTQLRIWEEALNTDAVKIAQLRLSFNKSNYPTINRTPWQPEAAKAKREPEEFRQIWLNPDEDIPRFFAALERAGFIDSKRKWIAPDNMNNPGAIIDAIRKEYQKKNPPLLYDSYTRQQLIGIFGKRLDFPWEGKRFEAKNTPYDTAFKKMKRELELL